MAFEFNAFGAALPIAVEAMAARKDFQAPPQGDIYGC
jgi:hypothetical protein